MKRLVLLLAVSLLSVVLAPIVGHTDSLWPLQIGDRYTYQYSDSEGAVELYDIVITGTTVVDSKLYFTTNDINLYLGSTMKSVYALDEGVYKEWVVSPSTPMVPVSVPYNGSLTAYLFTTYFSAPSNYQHDYIVPGLGIVKSTEHDDANQMWWEWGDLVDRQVVPAPNLADAIATMILMAGLPVSPDTIRRIQDVDGDDKIGLPESIHIMQSVAGIR